MIRRALRWSLYAVGLILLLIAAVIAALQTAPGKRLLASQLSAVLTTADSGIEITGIEGWIPVDMRIGGIRLSDRDGAWLSVEGVTVDWSPGTLLSGVIRVDEIGARRVDVIRPPIAGEAPEPVSDEPFRLPELPEKLPALIVERLAVPEVVLGETVMGEAASFALEGSVRASDDGRTVTAKLDLDRTDEATASVGLDARLDLRGPALGLSLDASETGGMVGRLAGRPEIGALTLGLDGEGPLDAWSGRLNAEADGLAGLSLDLGLALVDQPRMTIEGAVEPAPGMLPADLAPLIGEELAIDLAVVQTAAQALDIEKANLAAAIARLESGGAVDFEGGGLSLQADLNLPDLTPISPLAKAELEGGGEARLTVTGTLTEPEGRLDLKTADLAFDGRTADAIETQITWTTSTPMDADGAALDVVIGGDVRGLALPGTPLPDPAIGLSAALSVPLEGALTIQRAEITTAGTTLAAEGEIDPAALEGTIDLSLNASSLARLAEPYGQALDGRALITAAVGLAGGGEDVDLDLDASLEELTGLPPGASELLGERATLRAKARLEDGLKARLDDLTFEAAHVGLTGRAAADLGSDDVEGRIDLALSDLSALDGLVQDGIEGAIDVGVDLGGTVASPSADIALKGRDLVIAGEAIAELGLDVTGRDLVVSPTGDLALDLTARGTPTSLALTYHLADQLLSLDGIQLRAPETSIGGALAVALETTLVDGTLSGRIGDLGALEPLSGQVLGGSVDLSASLKADDGKQDAAVVLEGRNVEGDFGRIGSVLLDAEIADAQGDLRLNGKTTVTAFEQGSTTVDALTLSAKGGLERLTFDLGVAGEAVKPFDVETGGSVAFADGLALDLERLDGAFAEAPLRLARPLAFRQRGNVLKLSGLDLRLGEAALSGDVEIGQTSARGAIDLRSLPLTWSETFGGPALTGSVDVDIDLEGPVARPKITTTLRVDDLVGEDVALDETPIDLTLDALLDQGRLNADLGVTGLTDRPITANARLPASLALRPFAFELPESGALAGNIDAELQLARLGDILALDGQDMSGRLTIDLMLDGTLAEPKVAGPVELADARYENLTTGTDLRDLNMRAIASTERIDVERLSGRTGKSGTLSAEGGVQLDADADFPLSVRLRLDKARLVDRDDAEATISGEIGMVGSLADPSIEGDLTVDGAEIQIPEGGGPNLPELDVEEVGGNIVNPPKDEAGEEEERPFDPALGIRIRLPNRVYVRGRGLESEWQGDLDITGRASDPQIVGDLSIKTGYFDFLDKRFELEQGEISFSGGSPPNPILALQAVSEEDDFKAIIRLTGPADDPQILLESEPILPEDEILARLLFNRQLSQIGPVEAAKLALAVNRLRGGGGFDAFGEIRGILKIDTLDVVSDEEGDSAVRAGKYLSDDVYLEVEKGTAEESGRARVEIELLPNIAVEAETSENANTGVGVKWKLDY